MIQNILSPEDQADYFPGVDVGSNQLFAAIAKATAFAEGIDGANRKLSVTEYAESPLLDGESAILSYWPIVVDAEGNPELTIEYRDGTGSDGFGRVSYGSHKYKAMSADDYSVDVDSGEIRFSSKCASMLSGLSGLRSYSRVGMIGHCPPSMDGRQDIKSQIRIKYKAGFNFDAPDDELTHDARLIKALVADIMIANDASAKAFIKEETVTDFHSIKYSADSSQMQLSQSLSALKRYCPRGGF